jgi:hypothetical protein
MNAAKPRNNGRIIDPTIILRLTWIVLSPVVSIYSSPCGVARTEDGPGAVET